MSVATGGGEAAGGAGGGGARVFFQSPRGGAGGSPGASGGSGSSRDDSAPVAAVAAAGQVQPQQRRHQQGKVTVKYDRKELRKRLVLEEWIVEQLGRLYGCEVLRRRGGGRDLRRSAPTRDFPGSGSWARAAPSSWGPSPWSASLRDLSPPGALCRRGAASQVQLPWRAAGSLDGVGRGLGK